MRCVDCTGESSMMTGSPVLPNNKSSTNTLVNPSTSEVNSLSTCRKNISTAMYGKLIPHHSKIPHLYGLPYTQNRYTNY